MILKLLGSMTKALESRGIDYMVTGSIAMNSYTVPRMTLDIDIVIELNEENLEAFFQIFDKKFYLSEEAIRIDIKRQSMFNVIHFESGLKVDFIVRKDAEFRLHEFQRRRKIKFGDTEVWIVSPEDLIISKIGWIQQLQSDRQITDIKNLLSCPEINRKYIAEWCNKLKLNTFDLL